MNSHIFSFDRFTSESRKFIPEEKKAWKKGLDADLKKAVKKIGIKVKKVNKSKKN